MRWLVSLVLIFVSVAAHALACPTVPGYRAGNAEPYGYGTTQSQACSDRAGKLESHTTLTDTTYSASYAGGSTCSYQKTYFACTSAPGGGRSGNCTTQNTTGSWTVTAMPVQDPNCSEDCASKVGQIEKRNFTIGWSRVSGDRQPASGSINDVVGGVTPPPATACDGSCSLSVGGASDFWHSKTPAATGLYRLSVDANTTYTGGACSSKTPALDSTEAPKSCDGAVGDVNGVRTCVAPVGSVPQSAQQPVTGKQGNPAANSDGSKGIDDPARTPADGDGSAKGGPPAAGDGGGLGQGGTGAGSGSGTGSGTGGGTGTGGDINVEVETCGLPGKPACRMDETGTPTGQEGRDAYGTAGGRLDEAATAREASLADVATGGAARTVLPGIPGYSTAIGALDLPVPSGACSPINIGVPRGPTIPIDICGSPLVALWRSLLAWFMGMVTLLYAYRSLTQAQTGSK